MGREDLLLLTPVAVGRGEDSKGWVESEAAGSVPGWGPSEVPAPTGNWITVEL